MSIIERYGDPTATLGVTNETLNLLLAHRSVRKFTDEPVGDTELLALVAAAQSASTSSNLQPWSVIAIGDRDRKTRLADLAGGQRFIIDAPLFVVWVADLGRARRLAERTDSPLDGADYLETTILSFIDVSLAAQNAVVAAESLGLGVVFVGAIRNHPDGVADELRLAPHTVAAFGLAVGHPHPNECAAIKPRLPVTAVLHRERYDAGSSDRQVSLYDERLAAYNDRFGLPGNWSERVLARLAGPQSLSGRHRLRAHLDRLGLPSR